MGVGGRAVRSACRTDGRRGTCVILETEDHLRRAMLADGEGEHLEFKAARSTYDFAKLVDYLAALANEGGGHLILGVTDAKPRTICGTAAFPNVGKVKADILTHLRRRVDVTEIPAREGRVLVFRAPPAPPGNLVHVDGRYLMRVGEGLTAMTPEVLRERLLRDRGDLSAEPVAGLSPDALDPLLVARFRSLVVARARRRTDPTGAEHAAWAASAPDAELLEALDLAEEGVVTLAALALLGHERALDRHLPQAEIIFEYRAEDASIDYQERRVFRRGFLGLMDELWALLDKRNEVQSFQAGLLRHQVPTFAERSVREALLNAVCHRSYADQGSVRVLQFRRRLDVISPGGFPPGVSPANILAVSRPRNRRLHEALERCGLVERSSQGADLMFREALTSAKPQPSFAGSDAHTVHLSLDGQVRDERLLAYLERVGTERMGILDVTDLLVIDGLARSATPDGAGRDRLQRLAEMGLVERTGRGRWMLSRGLYAAMGQRGAYTRHRGLDHETEKALLLRHLRDAGSEGSPIGELLQVLPARSRAQVRRLLTELRSEGRAAVRGQRALGRWFAPGGAGDQDK